MRNPLSRRERVAVWFTILITLLIVGVDRKALRYVSAPPLITTSSDGARRVGDDVPDILPMADVAEVVDATASIEPPRHQEFLEESVARSYEPGIVIVQPREDVTAADVVQALREVPYVDVDALVQGELTAGLVAVPLTGEASVEDAVSELAKKTDTFADAQPNYVYRTLDLEPGESPLSPSDAFPTGGDEAGGESGFGALVQEYPTLGVNDPRVAEQWALSSMRVFEAWAMALGSEGADGRAVTVAVLDDGFDIEHEDLAANVVAPYDANLQTVVEGRMEASDHGTHVAGIVSAVADNAVGVAGVSHNARVMPVKATNGSGEATTLILARAIDYVLDHASEHNVRVVNISMGSVRAFAAQTDAAVLERIDRLDAAGIVTVGAAGNQNTPGANGTLPFDNCYPAEYGPVVSVINLERDGDDVRRCETSNYNVAGEQDKNVSAPGSKVLSTTSGRSRYDLKTGTSMAAPQVAGVLALMFAANPDLSAEEARDALYDTARDLGPEGFDEEYGYGEVDAYAAVLAAKRAQVTGLSLDADELEIMVDDEPARLVAALEPAESTVKVSWTSSDDSVASVADGVVTPVGAGTATITAQARSFSARCKVTVLPRHSVRYVTHIQNEGWEKQPRFDGGTSGSTGKAQRLEGITIRLAPALEQLGSVAYRTHIQNKGWEGSDAVSSWAADGALSGTERQALRLEAIQIALTGELAQTHDVWYRVHAQNVGWMGWAKNGAKAGTASRALRLEAIEIKVIEKGDRAPGGTEDAFLEGERYHSGVPRSESLISYHTHVQNVGDQAAVRDGQLSGTTGRALRLEGLWIELSPALLERDPANSVVYRAHVQNLGWEGAKDDLSTWSSDGSISGTARQALRLEAVEIELMGPIAETHDVWYQVHAQNCGWLGWARNGESAGTAGYGYRLEALRVQLLPKGSEPPGSTRSIFNEKGNPAMNGAGRTEPSL